MMIRQTNEQIQLMRMVEHCQNMNTSLCYDVIRYICSFLIGDSLHHKPNIKIKESSKTYWNATDQTLHGKCRGAHQVFPTIGSNQKFEFLFRILHVPSILNSIMQTESLLLFFIKLSNCDNCCYYSSADF